MLYTVQYRGANNVFFRERLQYQCAIQREKEKWAAQRRLSRTNRISLTLCTLTRINWREEYSKHYCLALLHRRDKDGLNFGAFIT